MFVKEVSFGEDIFLRTGIGRGNHKSLSILDGQKG